MSLFILYKNDVSQVARSRIQKGGRRRFHEGSSREVALGILFPSESFHILLAVWAITVHTKMSMPRVPRGRTGNITFFDKSILRIVQVHKNWQFQVYKMKRKIGADFHIKYCCTGNRDTQPA